MAATTTAIAIIGNVDSAKMTSVFLIDSQNVPSAASAWKFARPTHLAVPSPFQSWNESTSE